MAKDTLIIAFTYRQMKTAHNSVGLDQFSLLSLCGCYEGTQVRQRWQIWKHNLLNNRKPLVLCEFLLDLHDFLLMLCIFVTNLHEHVTRIHLYTGKCD